MTLEDGKLPAAYGRSRLVLLVVDPYLIHAYWEVTPEKLDEAKKQVEDARAVLRFYDAGKAAIESTPAHSFDVEIELEPRRWYVHLWSPEKCYYAELGLRSADEEFVCLIRSQVIHTPRAWPVTAIEQRFAQAEPRERREELVPTPPPAGVVPARRLLAKPIDFAAILRNKLAKLYAFRKWRRKPLGREPTDLTAMAEGGLTASVSSSVVRDRGRIS